MESKYNEIEVLEQVESIRKNAQMYVGATNNANHLFLEIFSNSLDEHLANYTNDIQVIFHKDGSISVSDFGRGIPNSFNKKENENNLILAVEKVHSGGKFSNKNYNSSAGLHGLGLTCTNFLSTRFKISSWRDGKLVSATYTKGKRVDFREETCPVKKSGTMVRFVPDEEIFTNPKCEKGYVKNKIKELSYLCPNLRVQYIDEQTNEEIIFELNNGIVDYVKDLSNDNLLDEPIYLSGKENNIDVEVALQWLGNGAEDEITKYYTNNVPNSDGGTHQTGFKSSMTRTLNNYISNADLPKSLKISLSGDDIREGLVSIISIKHPRASYSSQTKDKLVSDDARTAVESIISTEFMKYLEQNPGPAKKIVNRIIASYKAREAARKAREAVRKTALNSGVGVLPGKLADCQSNNPEECELFIVEGASAGGSAKQGRDRRTQAILPLRGKVLNTEKCELKKVLDNEELQNIITVLGCGFGKKFDISKLRYNKIILTMDADVDGSHIRALILTFFFRQMPQLIVNGNVYIAQPPLFRLVYRGRNYIFKNDAELKKYIKENNLENSKLMISRYKGLGEMLPNQLWETTMDPEERTLLKVRINDYVETDRIFNILMGKDVEPRKQFIIENCEMAINLDI